MATRPVYIRLPEDMVTELDVVADWERGEHPGREVTRVDVIREMLARERAREREKRRDGQGGPKRGA